MSIINMKVPLILLVTLLSLLLSGSISWLVYSGIYFNDDCIKQECAYSHFSDGDHLDGCSMAIVGAPEIEICYSLIESCPPKGTPCYIGNGDECPVIGKCPGSVYGGQIIMASVATFVLLILLSCSIFGIMKLHYEESIRAEALP